MVDMILLGAPGAGKGTQAELLAQWLDPAPPRVSSGDLFRAHLRAGTPLGRRAKGYMDCGELVPDEITIGMVAERISQQDCADGVIFDGFPRTVAQAEALDKLLREMGRRVDVVLYVRVAPETLLQRLAGRWTCRDCGRVYHKLFSPEKTEGLCDVCGEELYQRTDDTVETQKRRIDVYLAQTAPLEAYYREQGVLIEIDGEQGIESVQEVLRQALAPFV